MRKKFIRTKLLYRKKAFGIPFEEDGMEEDLKLYQNASKSTRKKFTKKMISIGKAFGIPFEKIVVERYKL